MPDERLLSEAEQRVFHTIHHSQQQAAGEILEQGPAALAENAHAFVDALVAQAPGPPRACAVFCAFCCHLPVTVEAPEPFAIVAWLRARLSPEQLSAFEAHLAARVQARRGWTSDQRVAARWPCVFLERGRCTIYAVRPLGCRGYQSFSRQACETAYETQAQVPEVPTVDRLAWFAAYAVRRGLRDAVHAQGLDDDAPELESAVLAVLTRPDAAARWSRGKRLYAKADRL
jgi:Fe-S-cluster containining protein